MADPINTSGRAVPSSRLTRLWHLGRASADFAAGIGLRGMLDAARGGPGSRIELSPAATRRITDRLARMRGAAMKMGQLLSMDGSDLFTPEAAGIMAQLRDRAEPMPMSQLVRVLDQEWGNGWRSRFKRFEFTPIAAASIGQVHRAETRDGRRLALKVQFPGVREGIDSDIDNLAMLSRTVGMLPRGLDPAPIFAEARRQLHQETDYAAEAAALTRYAGLIGEDPDLCVPRVHEDLSTSRILAMDFADGVPVDRLAGPEFTRADRDRVATLLTRLSLRELFQFQLVQTDPNFGNFLYDQASRRVVLLDFGATAPVAPALVASYRALAAAALADDRAGMRDGAVGLGYLGADDPPEQVDALLGLLTLSSEVMRGGDVYDFGTSDLFERVYLRGRDMYFENAFSRFPDPATLFLHRKFVGTFMLCRRLRARVPLRGMLEGFL